MINKMMQSKIITIILTISGIFWMLFYLFLWFIKTNSNLFVNIIFVFIFLTQICYLFRMTENHFGLIFIKYYNLFINNVYLKPLNAFYDNIFKNIIGIGDILMILLKYLKNIYIFFGKTAIKTCCILFFCLPQTAILMLVLIKLFLTNSFTLYILILIPLYRIFRVIFFILDDFALHNMEDLKKYLIINKKDNQIFFDLNKITVKEHSQEKLKLYAARFMLFREVYGYTMSTIHYENKNIKPWFKPFFISGFFISSLKIFSNLIGLNIDIIFFIVLFIIIVFKEYNNIKKEQKNGK